MAAFVAGQYVAPALVWSEEQVGGVQRTFYASFEGRLLAQAVLFGLAAGLFLVLLGGLRAAVVVAAGAVAAGLPLQAALAGFLDQGWFARHVRRMRGVYAERHRRIVEVLGDRFTDHLKVIPSSAGLHVAATAPAMSHEELAAVLAQASAAGVELRPLSLWDVGPPSQPGITLGYGAIPTGQIDEGLERLRATFDRHQNLVLL